MKAIGYTDTGPISVENALIEFELDTPQPGPQDLLVEVRGISVNPVDVKLRGHIALIDDPESLDVVPLKSKALSVSGEFMFARSMFQTDDMDMQHKLLTRVSELLDNGTLISTVNKHGGALTVENLKSAHEFQESGTAIGKTVLDGFS